MLTNADDAFPYLLACASDMQWHVSQIVCVFLTLSYSLTFVVNQP